MLETKDQTDSNERIDRGWVSIGYAINPGQSGFYGTDLVLIQGGSLQHMTTIE
jgi:hypothetical protein